MPTIVDTLRTIVAERSRDLPDDDFRLRALWGVDYRAQPTAYERFMVYSFVMAQTLRQGCCYADFGTVSVDAGSDALIGGDARVTVGRTHEESVAILDAAFGVLPHAPQRHLVIEGRPADKALARAEVIVDETLRQLRRTGGKRVAQIGVLGNLLHLLQQEDVTLAASDFDPELIEHGILGLPVQHGDRSAELVADADVALVCGETLASDTLDELVAAAREHGTRMVVFAVSGCHFAEEYVRTFGIDAVVSEPQPQYLFQGSSVLEVFRREA